MLSTRPPGELDFFFLSEKEIHHGALLAAVVPDPPTLHIGSSGISYSNFMPRHWALGAQEKRTRPRSPLIKAPRTYNKKLLTRENENIYIYTPEYLNM